MGYNQYDISGTLTTYAMKAASARSKKHLQQIIRDLKAELNYDVIRTVKFVKQDDIEK